MMPSIKLRYTPRRLRRQDPKVVMREIVQPQMEALLERIIARTIYTSVKDEYRLLVDERNTTTTYSIVNESPLWAFEEYDIQPHDIPQPPHYVPAGKLLVWMDEMGIPESFFSYIENKLSMFGFVTHHPGHEGDYVLQDEWERSLPAIRDAHVVAINEMCLPDTSNVVGSAGSE